MVIRRGIVLALAVAAIATISGTFAAATEAIHRAARSLGRFAWRVLETLATRDQGQHLALEGYHDYHLLGDPLPGALLNSLRHESRVANVVAPRHV